MTDRLIYITEFDLQRLKQLIADTVRQDRSRNEYIEGLEAELERGQIVAPSEVPPDVITMNSRVRLIDLEDQEEMVYTLVFPDDANLAEGKISVLAPIGTAMLGYSVGDVFTWKVPDGIRRIRVAELLFQPESSGRFDL